MELGLNLVGFYEGIQAYGTSDDGQSVCETERRCAERWHRGAGGEPFCACNGGFICIPVLVLQICVVSAHPNGKNSGDPD
jgi:hypothetical protein